MRPAAVRVEGEQPVRQAPPYHVSLGEFAPKVQRARRVVTLGRLAPPRSDLLNSRRHNSPAFRQNGPFLQNIICSGTGLAEG